MKRKVKLLHSDAKVPIKKHPLDAGYDCFLIEKCTIPAYSSIKIPLGIAIEIKPNEMLTIRSRSSAKTKGVSCTENTCDAGYTGQLFAFLINHTSESVSFEKGERVVQLVFVKIAEHEQLVIGELDETTRGNTGFGSTGKF